MKAGYLKKINNSVTEKIVARHIRLQKQAPLEAVMLQFLLIELFLRSNILVKLNAKKKKYFDNDDCKFEQLVDYYDLLGGGEKLVLLLMYNKGRNMIMHHALKFKSMEALENEANETFDLGQKIIDKI